MGSYRELWSIVLAAGEGVRLQQVTRSDDGQNVPKQYCSINGGPSLLRQAIARSLALTTIERTTVVVAQSHRRFWDAELADLPRPNVIVQPCNRGTACGLLLPLLSILDRDPGAVVLVLPSDHVVIDERVLCRSAERAAQEIREDDRCGVVLLGVEPQTAETGYGWVLPATQVGSESWSVEEFIEKPDRETTKDLMRRGALWNSFMFLARGSALLALFESVLPWLVGMFIDRVGTMKGEVSEPSIEDWFELLPTVDFSERVLQQRSEHLRVVQVPPCGWSDVGTPERVAEWISLGASCPLKSARSGRPTAPFDLADAIGRHHTRHSSS